VEYHIDKHQPRTILVTEFSFGGLVNNVSPMPFRSNVSVMLRVELLAPVDPFVLCHSYELTFPLPQTIRNCIRRLWFTALFDVR